MALTRFLRQVQVQLDGMVTDREIFTGLSSSTLQVWSIQRVECVPVGSGGVSPPFNPDPMTFIFRLAEEAGTYGLAQGLENPKVLMHLVESSYWGPAVSDSYPSIWGPTRWPMIWEAPKGLITHAPTLYATSDSTFAGFAYWSMRIYYTLLQITQDDLVFLRSVR